MRLGHWVLYGGIVTLWMIFGWLIWLKTPAHAHSWYPPECCHNLDCAPVTSASHVAAARLGMTTPLPVMVVTTPMGAAIVPPNFPLRRSRDGRMHACLQPDHSGGGMKLICLFMPDGL